MMIEELFRYSSHSSYGSLMTVGVIVTLLFWSRLAKRDERLFLIYICGLGGAFLGAKIIYMASEGWLYWYASERWIIWAMGKSVLGALLGGYVAVEITKRCLGYGISICGWGKRRPCL